MKGGPKLSLRLFLHWAMCMIIVPKAVTPFAAFSTLFTASSIAFTAF